MKIKKLQIKNFRAFENETVYFNDHTSLVGPNGAGKSTILSALNIFFREQSNTTAVDSLVEGDFHKNNVSLPIEITVTFTDFEERAAVDLADYARGGELIVSAKAKWDEAKRSAPVIQYGSRLGILALADFFTVFDSGTAAEVNAAFERAIALFPGISSPTGRSKDAKKAAIRAFELDPANADLLTPIESKDQFYGFAGGSKLKPFIQWVYVPAVKDASEEQSESRDSALGRLLARTVRAQVNFKDKVAAIQEEARKQYQDLLGQNRKELDQLAKSLTDRMSQWSHPDVELALNWVGGNIDIREPTASVVAGEHGFKGDLARFGNGFQRSYLLALLQELASLDVGEAPTLALGIEEPELFQHPPQARHLAQVLEDLSIQNSQVVLTTHSPYFVRGSKFEDIRMIRKDPSNGISKIQALTFEDFANRFAASAEEVVQREEAVEVQLNEVLRGQINELFFATKLVLVEGQEDVAHIMTWMALTGRLSHWRSAGLHIVSVDGKRNMARPLIVSSALGIPCYVVFDSDGNSKHRPEHVRDNGRILRLLGREKNDIFPDSTVWGGNFTQWKESLSDEIEKELKASMGDGKYMELIERTRVSCGLAPSLDKNSSFIQRKLMACLDAGHRPASLDTLCQEILKL